MSIPPATNRVQGPAIRVRRMEKAYKELRVLRGVDFEVARGSESISLTEPLSGSGAQAADRLRWRETRPVRDH